jgi:hypothetical protein
MGHGSVHQPRFQFSGEPIEPLAALRADLRFREDRIHTTLTLRKNAK